MKSLEIINAKLNIVKQQKEDCVMEYKYFNDDNCDEIIALDRKITELQIIKQDLEVLEILEPYILKYGNVMTLDTYLHSFCQDDEIDKLEKWLVEQE